MSVELVSKRRLRGIRADSVRADARRLLRLLGSDAELSIALVGDPEMQQLNARYRNRDRPTDVLAFPVDEELRERCGVLGDVVISLDSAARQAAEQGIHPQEEVRTLLVHGVLHLFGYDHEKSPSEARRMFARQKRLVERLHAPDGDPA